MVARGDVAGVDPLDPALLERLELLEAVDVPRDRRAVDLDRHRIEPQPEVSPSFSDTNTATCVSEG